MQCECEVDEDNRAFTKLCDRHYALKIKAMTRERELCREAVTSLMPERTSRSGRYESGLIDADGAIEDLASEEAGLDDHSFA